MTIRDLLRRPSAFLPVAMSATALLTIVVHLALVGTAPQADEGAAAHLWQLLMGLQLPFVAFFAIKSLPEAPGPALGVLALQAAGIASALAPVALLHW